ncbi:MAG: hypothetical protein ABI681_12955 [Gemmatimonadales bacterium]
MSFAARVYAQAPLWMQNLLVSAYGIRLRRLRYGRTGGQTLTWLRDSQWLGEVELRRYQLATLSNLVAQAAGMSFYRRRGLERIEFQSVDQLLELPLLTKSEVQSAGRELIAERFRNNRLCEIHTGGTTGKPLTIYCDRETLQRNYAFFSRIKETAGIQEGARIATFAGRVVVPPRAVAPYWRHNRAANTLLFSSYHIGQDTLPAYVDALAEFRPALIDSYPSSLEPIARYLLEKGITSVRPVAVITSSETLFPTVRALLQRAFDCPVFDHYGGAEMVALIAQCEEGTYHVAPEFGFVEIVTDRRPAAAGECGEIIATGFINPVMPLIRYATGDYGVYGSGECRCGRAGQTIERIEGRMDDVIVTPEGNLVGRLDPIFKSISGLQETRIVQDAADHLRVEMVVSATFSDAMERELASQLRSRLGLTMRIDMLRVPRIERTAAGKLRTTVNLVYRRSPTGMEPIAM